MGKRKKGNPVHGWVNFNKPLGMTSTQAVGKVRYMFQAQKAGHAGTLDPEASGVLPIALGEATKTIQYTQDASKTYIFTAQWGESRTTDDKEGDVIATSDTTPTLDSINALLPKYTGDIEQLPPQFSALKIDGKRAYDLARDGQDVELKRRTVTINALTIENHDADKRQTTFKCDCGKGTYIRSIARDLGEELGCYGYVLHLERAKVGAFALADAISLDSLEKIGDNTPQEEVLQPVEFVLDDIPALILKEQEAVRLKQGQRLSFLSKPDVARLSDLNQTTGHDSQKPFTALALCKNKPVGLVTIENVTIKPLKIFNL